MNSMHHNRTKFLVFLGDLVIFYAGLVIAVTLRFGFNGKTLSDHLLPFTLVFLLWGVLFFVFNLYELHQAKPTPRNIGRFLIAFSVAAVAGIIFFYFVPRFGITPRLTLLIIIGIAFTGVIGWRRLFYKLARTAFKRTWFVIYPADTTGILQSFVDNHTHLGTVIYTDSINLLPIESVTTNDVLVITENASLDDLIQSQQFPGKILTATQAYESLFSKTPLENLQPQDVVCILARRNQWWTPLARMIEIICASLVLIATSPILLIASLLILIQDGSPVLYTQLRTGKNGVPFMLYKFRSMKKDAEKNGAQWATQNDNRVTMIGKILRKTHIDEIPQMINIIKGDIAIVGPRPERPEFVAQLETSIPYYTLRHAVKPGFTGWAQIKFRYARSIDDSREKFAYDMFYLRNRSLLLDIGIIVKTIQIIFTH